MKELIDVLTAIYGDTGKVERWLQARGVRSQPDCAAEARALRAWMENRR